jgi:cyanophycin synthetase
MNVANALAAAAAAWASGAHMHDIRQGLRTFSTSFFQAPGRLNMIEMNGYRVIIDYCHNVDGMRRLTEFVDALMVGDEPAKRGRGRTRSSDGKAASGAAKGGNGARADAQAPARTGRALGVIGIPGDRPDGDQKEYGRLAASAFDRIYVREDRNRRGREPGETAANVLAGVAAATKAGKGRTEMAEPMLDEMDATRRALAEARPGDLIVVCADDAAGVYQEAMGLNRAPRRATAIVAPGEMAVPEG